MEFEIWHYWLIGAIFFMILEIFIPSFIVFNIGIGGLFGTFAAAIGLSLEWQMVFFSVASLLSFLMVRPILLKYAYKKHGEQKTNVDALIGKTAKVVVPIDNSTNQGRVILDGDDWRAKSIEPQVIPVDTLVEIINVESIILFVKPINPKL